MFLSNTIRLYSGFEPSSHFTWRNAMFGGSTREVFDTATRCDR